MSNETTADHLRKILDACDNSLWTKWPAGERVKWICIEEGTIDYLRALLEDKKDAG